MHFTCHREQESLPQQLVSPDPLQVSPRMIQACATVGEVVVGSFVGALAGGGVFSWSEDELMSYVPLLFALTLGEASG